MRKRIGLLGVLVALAALPAIAQDAKPEEEKKAPDYSKPAIMYILYEVEVKEEEVKAPEPFLLKVPYFGTVGFVLAAPAGTSDTDASLAPTIDPFSLLSTPAAYTPYTFRDRWKERQDKKLTGEDKK